MLNSKKVIVMMPTYNAKDTLEITVKEIPPGIVDEILVINDASTDNTAEIAKGLNVTLITHEKNTGYGGSQKTGFTEALKRGADIVVMLHGDYQYDPRCIPEMVKPFLDENIDAVSGSRMYSKKSALKGGMHWWRFLGNIGLSILEESVFRLKLSEYHSGYRAYSAEFLHSVPYHLNSDSYLCDADITAQLAMGHYKIAEVPIPTRYEKRSLSPSFLKCVIYGISVCALIGKYYLHKSGIHKFAQLTVIPKKT